MTDRTKVLWLAMDGRARFDTDAASILEVLCDGVLDQPPRKLARREWKDHDACLCYAIKKPGQHALEPAEYLEDIV